MNLQSNTVFDPDVHDVGVIGSHEMLPSACYIICIFFRDSMCPMHLKILKLPRPTVLKKMRFQENTLFDL